MAQSPSIPSIGKYGTLITQYYAVSPDELPMTNDQIDQCLVQMVQAGGDPETMAGLRIVVISPNCPDKLTLASHGGLLFIQGDAGLSWAEGLVEINAMFCTPRVLGHELGHERWLRNGIWANAPWPGNILQAIYERISAGRFTGPTPPAERLAEDEDDINGPYGVAGTLDPNDDGGVPPWLVPGLPVLLDATMPVARYLRKSSSWWIWDIGFNEFDTQGTFRWQRRWWSWYWYDSRYEQYRAGRFEYWGQTATGWAWLPFTP